MAVMQSQIWKMLNAARMILQSRVRMTSLTVGSFQMMTPKTMQASVLKMHQINEGNTPNVLANVVEFIRDPAPAHEAAILSE